ncbi:MAG: nodulation protein NfeD [Proteobacteria bacterium]|nr:nodulation protein NfeD [Pseudomonadota bacterium]
MKKHHINFVFVLLSIFTVLIPSIGKTQAPPLSSVDAIWVLQIKGAIGPATSDYIVRAIQEAHDNDASLIVIQIDTPGGLDLAMREIIQSILDSSIPVVSYVFPEGARSASAGTYIQYASHIAAMAPATNLGAATPVQIGMPSVPAGPDDSADEPGTAPATAMERKIVNDASAYIRSLAELRGRNVYWAETAVTEAASLSANEALQENVIDFVATDLADLLSQIDGMSVDVREQVVTINTKDKSVEYHDPDWRTNFLAVISNPNLILILGMIGIYGIIIEFYSPGVGIPGVVGAICLLLAAYGLQLLPISYAGLGLIMLGLALMITEALIPSFGVLGIGGVIAFIFGAIILVDTDVDVYQVSLPLVAAIGVFSVLLIGITLHLFIRIRKKKAVSGVQTIVGLTGNPVDDFTAEGMVKIQGELWKARTDTPLNKGDEVKVLSVDGLTLHVSKT